MADPVQTPPTPIQGPAPQPEAPQSSPFGQQLEGSPFGDTVQKDQEATPVDNQATPSRTTTSALALIQSQPQPIQDLSATLDSAMQTATNIIQTGQEYNQRLNSVIQGTTDRVNGLQQAIGTIDPKTGQLFTPELVQNVQQTTAADRMNRIDDLTYSSNEEMAVHAISDKLAAGDVVGARALMNRMDPAKNSSFGVMRDFYTKSLVMSNVLEKANTDANSESVLHKILTTVMALPESFTLKTARELWGNVAGGTNGYQSSFLRGLFDPEGELGKQVLAFQSMNATDQAKYAPQLIKNIQSNTSMLGISDPGKAAEILNQFKTGVDQWARVYGDASNFLDMAMIAPMFRGIGTGLTHGTDMLTGMGARSAAVNRVANAFDTVANEGMAAATSRTAVVPDELIEQGLPKPVNPLLVPESKGVTKGSLLSSTATINPDWHMQPISIAGDVADQTAYAREVLNSPELQSITSPNRFFNPEEREVAIKATLDDIAARTKSNVLDYEPEDVRLINGQQVTQVGVTINRAFSSEDDALNWLRNQGYGADASNVKFVEGAKAPNKQFTLNDNTVATHPDDLEMDRLDDLYDNGKISGDEYDRRVAAIESRHRSSKETAQANIFNPQSNVVDLHPAEAIQDISGQWFPRVKVNMRETGFYTNDINPPNQHFFARWFSTPFGTSDFRLAAKGTQAGQVQQQWMRELKDMNKTVTKLSPTDRTYLREVVQKGVNEARWLEPTEFDKVWERATGSLPGDKVKAAYANYRTANDLDYELRNANSYAELATRGVEKVKFSAMGRDIDKLGIVEHDLKPVDEPMVDSASGIVYKKGDLTEARMKELEGEGHFVVTTEEPVKLQDGNSYRKFLVKKSEMESNQLPEHVLPYSEGGHRVYADKYFVKQAKYFDTADGAKVLDKPGVFVTAGTKHEAAAWAATMERARLAVRDGASAEQLDREIFQGQRGLPTGDDFIKGLSDGTWTTDHPFEALFDRELPTEYSKTGGKFSDNESGANGFYRTNGQLYYSAKGDALKNVNGDLAPTLDPFKMQNQALFNVARLSSFDDFKTTAVNRWVDTYGEFLEKPSNAGPSEVFNSATVSRRASLDLKHQIEGQREAIKRMLNFRTDYDRTVENTLRKIHEWMGDIPGLQGLSKLPLWTMEHNPVNMLRGLTFDMKLGMFNPGQLFVQVSTAFSAIAMSPGNGLRGLATIPAMIAYRTAVKNGVGDNVLDLLAKRGMGKLAGFSSEAEFKNYMKFLDKSGIFAFGDSHLLVNSAHPSAAYSFLNKQEAVRTAGRFFFNRAEDANRLVAARIAYDEAVKKFGTTDFSNFEFNEFFRARTENYSFNMSSTSAAAWQKGILSIPTQFWAYNWRMMEAMAGKQFTTAQKWRLLASQIFMAGAAGVPAAGLVVDYVNSRAGHAPRLGANPSDPNGEPSPGEQAWATVQRGMVDELVHLTTGADVQIGQRLGTGDFFQQTVEKLMGYSEYGDKTTPADMLGGATYSVFGEALGSAFALSQHWIAAETGGVDKYNMTQDDWDQLFKQVSSINNVAFKAYFAKQYGIYTSQKGRVLIDSLPPADAAFFALGFAPGELRDRSAIMAWKQNRQQMISDAAQFINNRFAESVREPDKFQQNSRIISQFVNMLPPEHKMEVLQKAHLDRDPSDYSRLLRIRQSTQVTDQAIEDINQKFNQPDATMDNEVQN